LVQEVHPIEQCALVMQHVLLGDDAQVLALAAGSQLGVGHRYLVLR